MSSPPQPAARRRVELARDLRDIATVAVGAVRARKLRTAMMALGPMLGVAAIVGVLGLSGSANRSVLDALRALGSDLVVVDAADEGSGSSPGLPPEAVDRVLAVPDVRSVTALAPLPGGVTATRLDAQRPLTQAVQPFVADASLLSALGAEVEFGRPPGGAAEGVTLAMAGASAANRLGLVAGEVRSILVGGHPVALVGKLRALTLLPSLDDAIFLSGDPAGGPSPAPTLLLVRTAEGRSPAVASALTDAITWGVGAPPVVRMPAGLVEARAQVDDTFRGVLVAMGTLALGIGGLGIANVMTISVLQRSSEIGVRRALGHRRGTIAAQLLAESSFVGLLGGTSGVLVGTIVVAAAAQARGWPVSIEGDVALGSLAVSMAVAAVAGIYPAARAARLEPLSALRLG